jgi:hypothetical protein
VTKWRASGQPATAYAARHGISPKTLSWWAFHLGLSSRSKRALAVAAPAFVPLEVRSLETKTHQSFDFEVELSNGRIIRATSQFDMGQLVRLLEALEGATR